MSSMYYKYELVKAADILAGELFGVKENETFVITADTESDAAAVDALAGAVFAKGGKPLVIWLSTPLGVSKAADPYLPLDALTGVLLQADCWVEFNKQWLLYSSPCVTALNENKRMRYMCLTGVGVETMVKCIGRVNYPLLNELMTMVADKVSKTKHMRMTNNTGHDISFDNGSGYPVTKEDGYARTPGIHMIAGQVAWTPVLDSINGRIVLDGSVAPGVGVVKTPVTLEVEKGNIMSVTGGNEAAQFNAWLRGFNHPQMLSIAHAGFGFNPGAALCGDILQDQRVWGSTTWGVGSIGASLLPPKGVPAPSHSDSVSLNTTVYCDGEMFLKDGIFCHTEFQTLERKLR